MWDVETEEYYFAVNDIVQVLTESTDVKQYVKRMRSRDPELNSKWGTICTPPRMLAPDGEMRLTKAATLQGILRIVQSIPSRKAEPLKQWLAEVGSQRIDQMIDPELTFQMAVQDYFATLENEESKLQQGALEEKAKGNKTSKRR